MKRQHVIGMFDSGVGGLTVMKRIREQLPDVRIIYVGDTARVPYGNRGKEELIRFGEEISSFLISQGAEAIVVACNTSSAVALPALRERFGIPIIGTIDQGARLAVQTTKRGRIGLIATEATVRSRAYSLAVSQALAKGVLPRAADLRAAYQSGEKSIGLVKAQGCPLFVPIVEAGLANSVEAKVIAKLYLGPLLAADVDAVILGCTHYPFLVQVIREFFGPDVDLVDPAEAMVEELRHVLAGLEEREEMPPAGRGNWHVRYYVSGYPELFVQVGATLLKEPITDVRQINWAETGLD